MKLHSLQRQKHLKSKSIRGLPVSVTLFRISSDDPPSHTLPSTVTAPNKSSFYVSVPVLSLKMWSISDNYSGSCIDWTLHLMISPVCLSTDIMRASHSMNFE